MQKRPKAKLAYALLDKRERLIPHGQYGQLLVHRRRWEAEAMKWEKGERVVKILIEFPR